jgi:hypothetical protein
MHGGATPTGIASPHAKDLRHSKHLKGNLLARYEEALTDPDQLNLTNEIALVDARIGDLLSRLDEGDIAGLWLKLQRAYEDFRQSIHTGDKEAGIEAMHTMGNIIELGANDQLLWAQLSGFMEQRRALASTEAKRRIAMQKTMDAKEGMALAMALVGVVRAHVRDRDTLAAIQTDLTRLLTRGNGGGYQPT